MMFFSYTLNMILEADVEISDPSTTDITKSKTRALVNFMTDDMSAISGVDFVNDYNSVTNEDKPEALYTFAEADRKMREGEMEKKKRAKGTPRNCPLSSCTEQHEWGSVRNCNKFISMPLAERRTTALKNRLCFKCLVKGHTAPNCRAPFACV